MNTFRLIALFAVSAALLAGAPLFAATLTVTSLADDGGSGELRDAITTAISDGGGDTIAFQSGLSGTITLTSALPQLSVDMTIQGNASPSVVVDGAGQFRVFNVYDYGGTVSISNLVIQNGSDAVDNNGGGGIFVNQITTLLLSNCTLIANNGKTGGGLSNDGATTITDCVITANNGTGGGGVFSSLGTLTVTGCTFSSNTSGNFGGGGINNNGETTAAISNCTFQGNSSTSTGGGIINFHSVTITNCTFSANSAVVGAGIANELAGSTPATAAIINCTLSGNDAAEGGGGIRNDAVITAVNSIFYGDTVDEISGNPGGTGTASFCDIQGGIDAATQVSDGGNNISSDPDLGDLTNNGGPTQTMALGDGSHCIGAGTSTATGLTIPVTDQRGAARPVPPSIGAYDTGVINVHTFPAGLTMLSVPTDYTGDPLASVLGYSNPKLAVWNPSSSTYSVSPTAPADALRVGQGYWLRVPAGGATISTLGSPGPTDWMISLVPGWNMIGDPLSTPIPLSSLTIVDSSNVTHTFTSDACYYDTTHGNVFVASPNGLNQVQCPYTFQPGDAAYESFTTGVTALTPYYGYWLYATEACTLEPTPASASPFTGTYYGTDMDTLKALGQTFTNTFGVPTLTIASDGTVTGSDQYGSLSGTIDQDGNVNLHIDASVDGYSGTAIDMGVLNLSNGVLSGTLNGTINTTIGSGTSTDVLSLTKE